MLLQGVDKYSTVIYGIRSGPVPDSSKTRDRDASVMGGHAAIFSSLITNFTQSFSSQLIGYVVKK